MKRGYVTPMENRAPWNAELMQHVIKVDDNGCEWHGWKTFKNKHRYVKAEPFIFPEDVDYQESCEVQRSKLPEPVKESIDSCLRMGRLKSLIDAFNSLNVFQSHASPK